MEEVKEEAVVEGEVVPEDLTDERFHQEDPEPGTDLVEIPDQQAIGTLFGTNDPSEIVERMTAVANHFNAVIQKQNLTTRISGREHVQVEGWQTVGSMMGVFPVKDGPVEELPWPDPPPSLIQTEKAQGKAFGYRASYRAQTLTGHVVGGGEASCSRTESKWRAKEDHAIRSMAQTRAQSKALAGALRFIVTMAGYESTPAEEMEEKDARDAAPFGAPYDTRADSIEKFARACVYLTDNAEDAGEIKRLLEHDAGYLPNISARAILHTARLIRDRQMQLEHEQKEEAESGGSDNE